MDKYHDIKRCHQCIIFSNGSSLLASGFLSPPSPLPVLFCQSLYPFSQREAFPWYPARGLWRAPEIGSGVKYNQYVEPRFAENSYWKLFFFSATFVMVRAIKDNRNYAKIRIWGPSRDRRLWEGGEYIRWNDVTESMATIRSPFCGYNLA